MFKFLCDNCLILVPLDTGGPTKDKTLETTVRNLFRPFSCSPYFLNKEMIEFKMEDLVQSSERPSLGSH